MTLYGYIDGWAGFGTWFIDELRRESAERERVELHVHCYGGSVLEGNLMSNAIKANKVPVDIYVDGIALSMAGMLLAAADKAYMVRNGFVMLHAPAAGYVGRGTAGELEKEAKLLRSIERSFVDALAKKTGKQASEVAKWMEGDNWFDAQEALAAGLIDGIFEPTGEAVEITKAELTAGNVTDVFNRVMACLDHNNQSITNNYNMDKKELISRFGLTGVTEAASDADIASAIEAKINAEKTAREAAENELKTHRTAEIKALLDGVNAKLTPETRKHYEAIGDKAGIEALRAAVEPLRSKTSFSAAIAGTGGRQADPGREGWDFAQWQKEDAKGLEAMASEDPDRFNALYRQAFGCVPGGK